MNKKKTRRKRLIISVIGMTMLFSSIVASAESYENTKSFTKIVLPETSGNVTLKAGTKTTSRKYGRAKITTYTNCSEVSCWFRSKMTDGYHYWLPYMVTIDDDSYHKINYCDAKSAYYKKGTAVDLRAENADERLDIRTEKVSGKVSFN